MNDINIHADKTTTERPHLGDLVHFTAAGILFRRTPTQEEADVSRRGMTVEVTDELIAATADRTRALPLWLQLAGDPDAQLEQLGRVVSGTGPAPDDLTGYDPSSARSTEDERDRRRRLAFGITDPDQQAAELRRIRREFGPSRSNRIEYRERGAAPLGSGAGTVPRDALSADFTRS